MDTCAEYFPNRELWYSHVASCHAMWLVRFKQGAARELAQLDGDLPPPKTQAMDDHATSCTSWEDVGDLGPEHADRLEHEQPRPVSIGYKAFFKAVESGDTELVDLALDRGVNVNQAYFEWDTALVLAIKKANMKMAELLLKRDADPFQRDGGLPPLFHIFQNRKCDSAWIELLLHSGVTLEAEVGPYCRSVLHRAVSEGRDDLLETLISKGAEIERADSQGRTPVLFAPETGNPACAMILVKHGANRNARDKYGGGVLHFAAAGNDVDLLKFWLEQGVDIDAQDDLGQSKFAHCRNSASCIANIIQLRCSMRAVLVRTKRSESCYNLVPIPA